MTATLAYSGTLVVETCWCGIRHAVPVELRNFQQRQFEDGLKPTGIYCPLGHSWVPTGETKADRLERQLEEARRQVRAQQDLRLDTERRLVAQKGATTRAKKRHAAGVCPCCKRTFQNVQRHMKTQHPDYDPSTT